ncbi:MAG: hypothetical protein J5858_07210 [Lentisphaeria bacterium]|nr:hypothetical protein [Lentisphaeria bacterium]
MDWTELLAEFQRNPTIETASALDAQGFLAAPGEDSAAYGKRLQAEELKIRKFKEQLNREKVLEPYQGLIVDSASEIPPEILAESAETTRNAYGFEVRWVPGFFPLKGLGLLWGGCSIGSYEDVPALFIIRRSFEKKRHFFIYSREELTSHELCHVARSPLNDMAYEEHFAYAISHSALRRYSGNCFKSEKDALFFLLPVFLLLAVQILRTFYRPDIPVLPFWILAFVWPVWLLIANAKARKRYFRAENALLPYTVRPQAVLFRCVSEEINAFSEAADDPDSIRKILENKKDSELRWQIIFHRFIKQKDQNHG